METYHSVKNKTNKKPHIQRGLIASIHLVYEIGKNTRIFHLFKA